MISVFFFQAEDGIRDHCVTGVQTCALPICSARLRRLLFADCSTRPVNTRNCSPIIKRNWTSCLSLRRRKCCCSRQTARSEERRVGKECRARRSAEPRKNDQQQSRQHRTYGH